MRDEVLGALSFLDQKTTGRNLFKDRDRRQVCGSTHALRSYFFMRDHNPATSELNPPRRNSGSGEAVCGSLPLELAP
jgi:hypothetical protein